MVLSRLFTLALQLKSGSKTDIFGAGERPE